MIAVNKADGDQLPLARSAVSDFSAVLRFLRARSKHWSPRAMMISAQNEEGITELWQTVQEHRNAMRSSGEFDSRRQAQRRAWLWALIDEKLGRAFREHPEVATRLDALESEVLSGQRAPGAAAEELLRRFGLD